MGTLIVGALLCSIPAHAQQSTKSALKLFEQQAPEPVVLCIDDKPNAGGQPSRSAYARAAANGFRSVMTLRAPADGVDVNRERFIVEQHKMRYLNIASRGKLPDRKQMDEFMTFARERGNHPMLVNCAFAERVAPFMMIFRIAKQGWPERRAVDEAATAGLNKEVLEKFARDYLRPGMKMPAGPAKP